MINEYRVHVSKAQKNAEEILHQLKLAKGYTLVALPCDFLPFEILRTFDIHPIVVSPDRIFDMEPLIDAVILPQNCCHRIPSSEKIKKITVPSFPQEYGESAISPWNAFLLEIIEKIANKSFQKISNEKLFESAHLYSSLRRTVRGISYMRKEKPILLTNKDLWTIFSHALIFPPEYTIPQLSTVLDWLNQEKIESALPSITSIFFGRCHNDVNILDELEQIGFLIVEDDCCIGRRSFDLSYNTESSHLWDEIILSFSFRAFCPCVRSVADRLELLSKLLHSY
ncbi:MAG: 2-hydroxyacyl-CoA dehydratase family protein, partial [Spirochaetes bacterium]|nr:2-hydroxyacyl-CoA dehydratase family protein [Spirochaetota bacterium]